MEHLCRGPPGENFLGPVFNFVDPSTEVSLGEGIEPGFLQAVSPQVSVEVFISSSPPRTGGVTKTRWHPNLVSEFTMLEEFGHVIGSDEDPCVGGEVTIKFLLDPSVTAVVGCTSLVAITNRDWCATVVRVAPLCPARMTLPDSHGSNVSLSVIFAGR